MGTFLHRVRIALPLVAVAIGVAASASRPVRADGDVDERRERCATRLSIALLGTSPAAGLLGAANPQDQVDALLADPLFVDRFARFTNSQMNPQPGMGAAEDATYTLSKYVLENQKPWRELFLGAYDVTNVVTSDANGLGYFRSVGWMERYAGNEEAGYRLAAAYRIMQNTTGLQLTATTNVVGIPLTAEGRKGAGCAGCHYTNWYALDLVAKVLSKRVDGAGGRIDFAPPTEGPQTVLGGKTIANDKELVTALVESDSFKVNVCRLAFGYLYGRTENTCESAVFERCIDDFTAKGTMQAAVAAVAKDASFCQ